MVLSTISKDPSKSKSVTFRDSPLVTMISPVKQTPSLNFPTPTNLKPCRKPRKVKEKKKLVVQVVTILTNSPQRFSRKLPHEYPECILTKRDEVDDGESPPAMNPHPDWVRSVQHLERGIYILCHFPIFLRYCGELYPGLSHIIGGLA